MSRRFGLPRRRVLVAIAACLIAGAAPATALATPAAPTGLTVNATGLKQGALTWTPPSGQVSGYTIYRNGVQIATTDGSTPNYFDTTAPATGSWSYTVTASDSTGTSPASTAASESTIPAVTIITSCSATPKGSGHYILGSDLTASGSNPCLTFQSGSNISLDGRGHTITASPSGPDALLISNVTGFYVYNLTIVLSNYSFAGSFDVESSSHGLITGTTIKSSVSDIGDAMVSGSDHIVANNNQVLNALFTMQQGTDLYVGWNTVKFAKNVKWAYGITMNATTHSSVVHNTIDGAVDQGPGNSPSDGTDDGISFDIANYDKADYNTISNVQDAGIEPVDTFTNGEIIGNTIVNAATDGIGEYWETAFDANLVQDNWIQNSPQAFQFLTDVDAGRKLPTGRSAFSMLADTFDSNTFSSPTVPSEASAEFLLGASGYTSVATSNVFTNNDFGTSTPTPTFTIPTQVSSSSNNTCPTNAVIVCHP